MRNWVLIGLMVLLLAAPALSEPPARPMDPDERPSAFNPKTVAFWIWHDGGGYHVRATTAGQTRVFSGWIEVDEEITSLNRIADEKNDRVHREGRRIEFRLHTARDVDGFDFVARWPHRATFFVAIEGVRSADLLKSIYIGGASLHPTSIPFSIVPASLRGMDARGRPFSYRVGQPKAFWIWGDDGGFHLRSTTERERHVFSGWIEAQGGVDVQKVAGLENTDFVVQQGGRIYFHLVVQGAEDGLDFRSRNSSAVSLFLMIDGYDSGETLARVFVGRQGAHPTANPFMIR